METGGQRLRPAAAQPSGVEYLSVSILESALYMLVREQAKKLKFKMLISYNKNNGNAAMLGLRFLWCVRPDYSKLFSQEVC